MTPSFNYFEQFLKQGAYGAELALNLLSGFKNGEAGTRTLMDTLHTVENDADQISHDIHEHLLQDFAVPLPRDSMSSLARVLDDVVDAVEDIAISSYVFNVKQINPSVLEMIDLVAQACCGLKRALEHFDEYAAMAGPIRELLIHVHTLESACDLVYIESAHALYADPAIEPPTRYVEHKMLEKVEEAMDIVENAAEHLETIIAESV